MMSPPALESSLGNRRSRIAGVVEMGKAGVKRKGNRNDNLHC
jgi:hypothetical protein